MSFFTSLRMDAAQAHPNVQVVSDLHLEYLRPQAHERYVREILCSSQKDTDLLLVAGDLCQARHRDVLRSSLDILQQHAQHVLYVPGNHEYYHSISLKEARELAWPASKQAIDNIIDEEVTRCDRVTRLKPDALFETSGPVAYTGCTLWSETKEPVPNCRDYTAIWTEYQLSDSSSDSEADEKDTDEMDGKEDVDEECSRLITKIRASDTLAWHKEELSTLTKTVHDAAKARVTSSAEGCGHEDEDDEGGRHGGEGKRVEQAEGDEQGGRDTEDEDDVEGGQSVVVVTHHLPTFKAIAKEYEGDSLLNTAFASKDCEDLLQCDVVRAWVCGHTHTRLEGVKGKVYCNAVGYPGERGSAVQSYPPPSMFLPASVFQV